MSAPTPGPTSEPVDHMGTPRHQPSWACRSIPAEVADALRRARQEHGWSKAEAARRLGVATQSVAKLERGVRAPSEELARRITATYGLSVDDAVMLHQASRPGVGMSSPHWALKEERLRRRRQRRQEMRDRFDAEIKAGDLDYHEPEADLSDETNPYRALSRDTVTRIASVIGEGESGGIFNPKDGRYLGCQLDFDFSGRDTTPFIVIRSAVPPGFWKRVRWAPGRPIVLTDEVPLPDPPALACPQCGSTQVVYPAPMDRPPTAECLVAKCRTPFKVRKLAGDWASEAWEVVPRRVISSTTVHDPFGFGNDAA